MPIGNIFLGMPKGFCRLGPIKDLKIRIFETKEQWLGSSVSNEEFGIYNKFNVPVWKYFDRFGNTLVRGLAPRINMPFLHVFLGDVREYINCLEITQEDIDAMD